MEEILSQAFSTGDIKIVVAAIIDGWHLPTSGEYLTLLNYAGGVGTTDAGYHLRATSSWNNGNNGNDAYGFNWVAAGQLTTSWDKPGTRSCLWVSASKVSSRLVNIYCNVDSRNYGKAATGTQGAAAYLSVRLIKDSE